MKELVKTLLCLVAIFVGCSRSYDKRDPIGTADEVTSAVLKRDTAKIRQLLSHSPEWDSWDKLQRKFLLGSVFWSMNEASNALQGKQLEVIKMDTASEKTWDVYNGTYREWLHRYIDVILLEDTIIHRLKIQYGRDSLSNIYVRGLAYRNLTNACISELKNAYQAHLIDIKEFIWATNYRKDTFTNGQVLVQNTGTYTIESLKFRAVLRDKHSNEFVNQIVTYNRPIQRDELVMIDLPKLKGYFTGRPLIKSEFTFVPTLIEILPKKAPSCAIIQELSKHKFTSGARAQ